MNNTCSNQRLHATQSAHLTFLSIPQSNLDAEGSLELSVAEGGVQGGPSTAYSDTTGGPSTRAFLTEANLRGESKLDTVHDETLESKTMVQANEAAETDVGQAPQGGGGYHALPMEEEPVVMSERRKLPNNVQIEQIATAVLREAPFVVGGNAAKIFWQKQLTSDEFQHLTTVRRGANDMALKVLVACASS